MKIKAYALGLLVASSLVACQADDEAGNGNGNNDGVQNTNFERMADDMNDRGNNNNANRDANEQGNNGNGNNNIGGNVNDQGNNNNGGNGADQHNYDVADKAAKSIEDNVEGINEAYVLTTNDNAYVATVLDNQDGQAKQEISDELEQQITQVVKDTDQGINNVYISSNPDFVDLTNNYVDDVANGEPVQGFFRNFGRMADRLFPDAQS
ncbi:YhcN/YlaJ family sporulation lipoprotein [Halobacillus shinanisalinarum]|uniref:YhcN/YlaJ family sporulation lipoprotein n=1 Tax=Halobacillus shinanisalinarum TaxID=2932258 RepID=A0ABY4GWY6_9BACI|nr:YhcN/YlaJ family sporulation lipoprotein [Halobacillus shinanisalinarum]UOQ92680.1 YhcN/YlaJ family sporulation lipoprotein [Halobacillus shinanisalinarum]